MHYLLKKHSELLVDGWRWKICLVQFAIHFYFWGKWLGFNNAVTLLGHLMDGSEIILSNLYSTWTKCYPAWNVLKSDQNNKMNESKAWFWWLDFKINLWMINENLHRCNACMYVLYNVSTGFMHMSFTMIHQEQCLGKNIMLWKLQQNGWYSHQRVEKWKTH